MVYVRAMGGSGQGLRSANVEIVAHLQNGDSVIHANRTDGSGSSTTTFGIGRQPPGHAVIIEIHVSYAGRTTTTQTSFIPWW